MREKNNSLEKFIISFTRNHLEIKIEICSSYLPKIGTLLAPDHIPTADDILHLRIPTTGVREINFTFSSNTIRWEIHVQNKVYVSKTIHHIIDRLIDVGGQRSYRKKWIHCFDGVAAVLFVASVAAYDQAKRTFLTNESWKIWLRLQSLEGVDGDSKPVLHGDLFLPVDQAVVSRIRFFGQVSKTRENKYNVIAA